MKRYFYAVLVLLLLASCSEQPSIENLIKSNLRDPDSAKFRNFIISKHNSMACIDWNARNSFGGYGEWGTAKLVNKGKGWTLVEVKISTKDYEYWCTQKKMDLHEATQEALKDILNDVNNMGATDSAINNEFPKDTIKTTTKPANDNSSAIDEAMAEAEAAVAAAVASTDQASETVNAE